VTLEFIDGIRNPAIPTTEAARYMSRACLRRENKKAEAHIHKIEFAVMYNPWNSEGVGW